MSKISRLFVLTCSIGSLLVSVRCSPSKENSPAKRAHEPYSNFSDTVTIEYAKNFTVTYHGHYKVVKTTVPGAAVGNQEDSARWAGSFSDIIVLVQRGAEPPPLERELQNAFVVTIPALRVAGNSDDAPTRLTALGRRDSIVGLGHTDLYDEYLKARADRGMIKAIGASWHSEPNLEMLLQLKPDVTFLTIASLTQSEGLKKTRGMGIPSAPDFSWSESNYLAQLEWIKYYGVFMNAEREATDFFNRVRDRCDSLKDLVARISDKPNVMWGMHGKGLWRVRVNDGFAKLMEDAGAINPFADHSGIVNQTEQNGLSEGVSISDEIVFQKLPSVNYIISFQTSTDNWPPHSYMEVAPAYRNRQLYHHFKRFREYGAYDWYQTASTRPDIVLADLVHLFHPDIMPGYELVFFGKMEIAGKHKK